MSKILGFVACVAMIAMLSGCKKEEKPTATLEGAVKDAATAVEAAVDTAAEKAAEVVE